MNPDNLMQNQMLSYLDKAIAFIAKVDAPLLSALLPAFVSIRVLRG